MTIQRTGLIGFAMLLAFALGGLTLALGTTRSQAQEPAWQTFASDDAAYSFEYPADSVLQTSEDASLRYKLVYVQFPITTTGAYQGASVLVIENLNWRPGQKQMAFGVMTLAALVAAAFLARVM